jgi:hypothetical protein
MTDDSFRFEPLSLDNDETKSSRSKARTRAGRTQVSSVGLTGKTYVILVDHEMCRGHVKGQGGTKLCIERDCEVECHSRFKEEVP